MSYLAYISSLHTGNLDYQKLKSLCFYVSQRHPQMAQQETRRQTAASVLQVLWDEYLHSVFANVHRVTKSSSKQSTIYVQHTGQTGIAHRSVVQ